MSEEGLGLPMLQGGGPAGGEPLLDRHLFEVRVYYEDTDAGGVVYHARYLAFAERARTEALRDAGVAHAELGREHGLAFMVRRVALECLAPARLDDLLVVDTRVVSASAAQFGLRQVVRRGASVVAGLDAGMVCVRQSDGRPARIPPRWRVVLAPGGRLAGRGDSPAGS